MAHLKPAPYRHYSDKIEYHFKSVCDQYEVLTEELRAQAKGSKYVLARQNLAYRLLVIEGFSSSEVADLLHCTARAVTGCVRRFSSTEFGTDPNARLQDIIRAYWTPKRLKLSLLAKLQPCPHCVGTGVAQ